MLRDSFQVTRCGTVESCVLWDSSGLQAHGFESCPRSECRLGFLTRGNGFLADEIGGTHYANAKGEEGDEKEEEKEEEEEKAGASRLLTRQSVLRGAEETKC
ncbi:hypothetical protein E2C01_027411 [Portunus trituberculatus]|uniref:Uncharacterized protein n=1 Tax=Portunus trituberculatus TaxID=210409 RepID=A0A5B7EL29_PORTR|nr:hypothetical protein [Portunus trituberculatus]